MKKLLQIILTTILIVVIEIPLINSVKSEGSFEDCLLQCQEDYSPGSVDIINCIKKCAEEAAEPTQPTTGTTPTGTAPTGWAGLVPCKDNCTVCDLLVLAQNVLKFAFEIAFLIVIGFIVYGGFRWIFSLGKEENLKAGQKIITNAIIGLVIILSAWIIVNTVFWLIAQAGGTEEYIGTWYKIECPQ